MERHYTNGTEPDVLPDWECHGPCQQGRQLCPTPEACERPGRDQDSADRALALMVVAATVVAVIVLAVLL